MGKNNEKNNNIIINLNNCTICNIDCKCKRWWYNNRWEWKNNHSTRRSNSIGWDIDRLLRKAQKQSEKYDKYNKKNPTTYTVTLSDKQYKKLGTAEKQDKYKSIQIETYEPVIIKKPVLKTNKVKIFSKTYYTEKQFNKALKKFEKRYDSDDYKIKIKTKYKKETDIHGHTFTIPKYNKITIYQKEYKVLYYKTKQDTVTAYLWVNDYKDYIIDGVYFGALKLGWYGGEIYSNEIYVEPYEDGLEGGASSGTSSTPSI